MITCRYVRNSRYARFRIPVSENIPFSLLPWPPPVFSLECLTTTVRWDRRQIFNRRAITAVNTVPLHLLQIQGTVTAHTGALLTQWNRPGTPSGGHTDCRLSSEFGPRYVIRMLSDTGQICVRLLLLIPSHYATSLCLATKFAHKKTQTI